MPAASSILGTISGVSSCLFAVFPFLFGHDAAAAGASHPANTLPPCAGVGDEDGLVFAFWECLVGAATKKPRSPLNALADDNWIGREHPDVRDAS